MAVTKLPKWTCFPKVVMYMNENHLWIKVTEIRDHSVIECLQNHFQATHETIFLSIYLLFV